MNIIKDTVDWRQYDKVCIFKWLKNYNFYLLNYLEINKIIEIILFKLLNIYLNKYLLYDNLLILNTKKWLKLLLYTFYNEILSIFFHV